VTIIEAALTIEQMKTTLPDKPDRRFLQPGPVVDSDHPSICAMADQLVQGKNTPTEKAVAIFYFVRDQFRYNLFVQRDQAEHFKASRTLAAKEGYCVTKAVLLAALSRAAGIPSGFGFARIRNNRLPEKTVQRLGGNILPFHGYTELFLEGKWVKATSAWDPVMCDKLGWHRVEFDGLHDAMLPAFTPQGERHVEYLRDLGHFDDVPLDTLWKVLKETFGTITLTR